MTRRNTRREILDFIIAYCEEHGYPPTVREIGQAVQLNSTSTVQYHLRRLKAAGLVVGMTSRTLGVYYPQPDPGPESRQIPLVRNHLLVLPVHRQENVLRYVSCPDLPESEGLFAVRVPNDAVAGAAVVPGDMVVVDPSAQPEDGDLAAILLERAVEVRLLRTMDGESWYASANETAAYREIAPDSCTLLGRVKSVVRQY